MRHLKAFIATTLMLVALGQAALAGPQDFTLFNRTGVDIYAVYVAPSDSEEWEENLIEGAQLMHGGDIDIVFAPDEEVELWDIRVEDAEGNFLFWREIDLFSAFEIILEPNGTARIKEVE